MRPTDSGQETTGDQQALRRLVGAGVMVGGFAVALAVHVGGPLTSEPSALLGAVMLAVSTGAFILTFPWSRYDPRWFVLVSLPVNGVIAWGASLTGGLASPVLALLFVTMAFAGAYCLPLERGGLLLAAQVLLAAGVPLVVGPLSPAPGAAPLATALVLVPSLGVVAMAARLAARAGRDRHAPGEPPRPPAGATPAEPAAGPAPRVIDDAVLSSLNLDGVLDQLLGGAVGRMGVERVSLALAGGQVLEVAGAADAALAGIGAAGRTGPGRSPARAPADGATLELPVAIGGERLGALRVVGRGGLPLDERQRAMARDLAVQAAVAIERARLFDRVFRATQELETLFHALRQGIAIAGRDGRIVRANRSFAQLLGLAADAIVGRPAADVLPGGVVPSLSHDQVIDLEERAMREVEDEARGRSFEVTTTPLFDPQFLLVGQVYIVRDVTEERRMKEHLLQSEKLAALGQLVAGVSHELNSPLGIILGQAELLGGTPGLDEEARRGAEVIVAQATRAARIVRQLLSFGRRHTPVKQEVCLNRLLREVVGLVEADFRVNRRRPIRVVLDLDPTLPVIMADPHQLEQVFLNIITNARQAIVAADAGSRIEVATAARGQMLRVRIADDGPGIPAAVLRRIFDPFFTTKPEGEGTGLGLSICYGIVKEHGGRIRVESAEGRGAVFTVELPIDGQLEAC